MIEHVKLVLTEAVEMAALAIVKADGLDWDLLSPMQQLLILEATVVPVTAAAPFIVQQVLNDIASRTYDIR